MYGSLSVAKGVKLEKLSMFDACKYAWRLII